MIRAKHGMTSNQAIQISQKQPVVETKISEAKTSKNSDDNDEDESECLCMSLILVFIFIKIFFSF